MKSHSSSIKGKNMIMGQLIPFTGTWNKYYASHLLRRTIYGPSKTEIAEAVDLGLDACVDKLLRTIAPPEPPLNYNDELDPYVSIGETWINTGNNPNSNGKRRNSLRSWMVGRAVSKEFHIREKMTLFFHNHLVVSGPGNAVAEYMYIDLLRTSALGNFKQLIKDITIDPSMLQYLNGGENNKDSPNENYARELLELFTVGKGPIAGPGDYTHYTEDDIATMAKVLTGWRDLGYGTPVNNEIRAEFIENRHDTSTKQLSHRFNNAVIENGGENEYKTLIDIIFEQDEVARFMCRNFYQWFVHSNITEDVENNVIEPLSQIMISENYEIKPVLKALLTCDHFYNEETIGCMIKNPMDFIISPINSFDIKFSTTLIQHYRSWSQIYNYIGANQLILFQPPSVAGWKAYYQSPGYYHVWLSSATLPLRQAHTDLVAVGTVNQGEYFGIDVLSFVADLDQPNDIYKVIEGFEEIIFCKPLSEGQRDTMKTIILGGLPDFEWTLEYNNYTSDPTDVNIKAAVENKLKLLVLSMLRLPEYQMS